MDTRTKPLRQLFLPIAAVALAAIGCTDVADGAAAAPADRAGSTAAAAGDHLARATFAGGCFWCVEAAFDEVAGVVSTTSGYAGGHVANPTYGQVSAGGTGHAESVQVEYDPAKVSYQHLLEVFWHNIDPTAVDSQFCDHGHQYRSAIFVADAEQRRLAEASKAKLVASGRFPRVATTIEPLDAFYPAEEYHQDYYEKNPIRYRFYRTACGRDARLHELWGAEAGGH